MPICHDVVVVEPKHAIAAASQVFVAPCVTFLIFILEMLRAIDLDDQSCIVTNEIHDERSDRRLSSKACAIETMSAHSVPDDPLGVGERPPQRPRADAQFRRRAPSRSF
jgi:hypothetical protein